MKKLLALVLALTIAMSAAACGSSAPAESTEEKKALPVASTEPAAEGEETHYKATMKPYSDIQHGKRIIVLQNTLQFSREGIMTEAEAPVPETFNYNGADYMSFAMTDVVKFLTEAPTGIVKVYTAEGTEISYTVEEFLETRVLIDDFQSGNMPILYDTVKGYGDEGFKYAVMENGEGIFSIVTEQEVNVNDMLTKYGWDNTKTYNLVATDEFYIPITPEDYDEGGLRGALSGAINASFVDMTIAIGKLNDVVFVEESVE